MPINIRINEPDKPGRIIPLIPTIPQIKTKNKFEFSFAGVIKFKDNANKVPTIKLVIVTLFQLSILFPTKYIEARIRPKKKAQSKIFQKI